MCCEAIPKQVYFLIDEGVLTGKGVSSTISYIHYFFEWHRLGETFTQIHVHNCGAQNKNNALMWYYLGTGAPALESDDRATYNFLIAGHEKFVPDWCFGLVKQRTRKTSISSLFDIARAVDRGFRDSEHGWVAWIAQWHIADLNVRLGELPQYIFQEDSASENLSSLPIW